MQLYLPCPVAEQESREESRVSLGATLCRSSVSRSSVHEAYPNDEPHGLTTHYHIRRFLQERGRKDTGEEERRVGMSNRHSARRVMVAELSPGSGLGGERTTAICMLRETSSSGKVFSVKLHHHP